MIYRAETPILSELAPRRSAATPRAFAVALCVLAGATGACRINTAPEPQEASTEDGVGGTGGDDDSRAGRSAKESAASGSDTAATGTNSTALSMRVDAGGGDPAEPAEEEPAAPGGRKSMTDAGGAQRVAMQAAAGSGGAAASGVSPAGAPRSGAAGHPSGVSGATSTVPALPQPSAAGAPAGQLDACSIRLAACLQDAPLNYDGCLRSNQERGCPPPDAGVMPSTVLDENGNPISQVCQAELAKCIMMMPTPEHALECTEKARTCK
jgi:hypothetical protein